MIDIDPERLPGNGTDNKGAGKHPGFFKCDGGDILSPDLKYPVTFKFVEGPGTGINIRPEQLA